MAVNYRLGYASTRRKSPKARIYGADVPAKTSEGRDDLGYSGSNWGAEGTRQSTPRYGVGGNLISGQSQIPHYDIRGNLVSGGTRRGGQTQVWSQMAGPPTAERRAGGGTLTPYQSGNLGLGWSGESRGWAGLGLSAQQLAEEQRRANMQLGPQLSTQTTKGLQSTRGVEAQTQTGVGRVGPSPGYIEGAREEFRSGLEKVLSRPGMQGAWRELEPLVTGAFRAMRSTPEGQAVQETITRELSPGRLRAERSRLTTEARAALRANEARDMEHLREVGGSLSRAELRRQARQIRNDYARQAAALPIQIDQELYNRVANMLAQGVSYSLGLSGQGASAINAMISQAGRFGLTPEEEGAMRVALMKFAGTPTYGETTETTQRAYGSETPSSLSTTGLQMPLAMQPPSPVSLGYSGGAFAGTPALGLPMGGTAEAVNQLRRGFQGWQPRVSGPRVRGW